MVIHSPWIDRQKPWQNITAIVALNLDFNSVAWTTTIFVDLQGLVKNLFKFLPEDVIVKDL